MKKYIFLGSVLGIVSPMITLAAENLFGVVSLLGQLLNNVIPVLITLAVVYFIWGVISYLIGGDEEKKKKAKVMIINGLIGLFIIISFWGIIALVSNTFLDNPNPGRPDIRI